MAQLRRSNESPQTPRSSPISDHLHLADHEEFATPTRSLSHDRGEHDDSNSNANHGKKSVLTKVRERAKKLRYSLSGKSRRHGNVHTGPPHCVVHSEDADAFGDAEDEFDRDQDPEYLGAPMYESEAAPENLKEHARQHPRAQPVLPKSHKCPSEALNEKNKPTNSLTEETSNADLSVKTPEAKHTTQNAAQKTESNRAHTTVPPNTRNQDKHGASSMQKYDSSEVSRALDEAMSPIKTTGEASMVDMVKEAVYSVFGHQEPSDSTAKAAPAASSSSSSTLPASANISRQQNPNIPNANSMPTIPLSNKGQEVVEEQNHGKILQAN